jgi:hypothetical protein
MQKLSGFLAPFGLSKRNPGKGKAHRQWRSTAALPQSVDALMQRGEAVAEFGSDPPVPQLIANFGLEPIEFVLNEAHRPMVLF